MKTYCKLQCAAFVLGSLFCTAVCTAALPIFLYQAIDSTTDYVLIGCGLIDGNQPGFSCLTITPHTHTVDFFTEPERDLSYSYSWEACQPEDSSAESDSLLMHLRLRRGTQPEQDLFSLVRKSTSPLTRSVTAKATHLEDDLTKQIEISVSTDRGQPHLPSALKKYQFTSSQKVISLSSLLSYFLENEEIPLDEADVFDNIFYTCTKADMTFYFAKEAYPKTLVVKIITLSEKRYLAAIGHPLTTKRVISDGELSSSSPPSSRSPSPPFWRISPLDSSRPPSPSTGNRRFSLPSLITQSFSSQRRKNEEYSTHPLFKSTSASRVSKNTRFYIPTVPNRKIDGLSILTKVNLAKSIEEVEDERDRIERATRVTSQKTQSK